MLPSSLYFISSLLSVLVIVNAEEIVFEIPGPDKLVISENLTFYFRFENAPSVCNDTSTILCVVKNGNPDKSNSKTIVNAGSISNKTLIEESSNHYSFTFGNGQICNDHGRNESYKTRFDFFCPEQDEKILNPVVLISSDKCSFNFFVWHRSKICQENHGTNGCILKLPEYEQTLDLTVLKKDTFYNVYSEDKKKHFQLNICGGIKKSKRCADDIHVCDVTNEKESVILSGKKLDIVAFYDHLSQPQHIKVSICIS